MTDDWREWTVAREVAHVPQFAVHERRTLKPITIDATLLQAKSKAPESFQLGTLLVTTDNRKYLIVRSFAISNHIIPA